MTFVHLHCHSDYSILDGAAKVEAMVERAALLGQPALALTDHGVMYGVYDLWKAGNKHGVKPIAGMEAYLAPGSRFDKKVTRWGTPEQREVDVSKGAYTHLTLLAENATGLRNLYKMHQLSHTEGFYHKPRIDLDLLSEYSTGVVVLSGCMGGATSTLIRLEHDAMSYLATLRDVVDPGSLYVEMMDHGIEGEDSLNRELLSLAHSLGLPVVATNDSHYTLPEDLRAQKAMLWLNSNGKFTGFSGSGYHLATLSEMQRAHSRWAESAPEALTNTLAIAGRVESYDEVFAYRDRMPRYRRGGDLRETIIDTLRGLDRPPEYEERANYELEIIYQKGYPDYFMTLAGIVRFCREADIWVGPGRGSAGGSLVAYDLGITGLDPIEHGLLFERFLSPTRTSPPDIDIDIEPAGIDRVISYIVSEYGAEMVAKLRTFGTIKARVALKDANRVLGGEFAEGTRLVGMVPPDVFGRSELLENLPKIREANPEVYDLAKSLEGLIRQPSIHAAGVVISPEPLSDVMPMVKGPNDDMMVTGFPNATLEALGMVKFDLLKLENLAIIRHTLEMLNESAT